MEPLGEKFPSGSIIKFQAEAIVLMRTLGFPPWVVQPRVVEYARMEGLCEVSKAWSPSHGGDLNSEDHGVSVLASMIADIR